MSMLPPLPSYVERLLRGGPPIIEELLHMAGVGAAERDAIEHDMHSVPVVVDRAGLSYATVDALPPHQPHNRQGVPASHVYPWIDPVAAEPSRRAAGIHPRAMVPGGLHVLSAYRFGRSPASQRLAWQAWYTLSPAIQTVTPHWQARVVASPQILVGTAMSATKTAAGERSGR